MTRAESWMIEYFVNSLWMVPLIFTAAWVAVRLVKSFGPRVQHRVWVAALLLEVFLPGVKVQLIEVLRMISALAFWRWGTKAGKGTVSVAVTAVAQAHGGLHLPHRILTAIAKFMRAAFFTSQHGSRGDLEDAHHRTRRGGGGSEGYSCCPVGSGI